MAWSAAAGAQATSSLSLRVTTLLVAVATLGGLAALTHYLSCRWSAPGLSAAAEGLPVKLTVR